MKLKLKLPVIVACMIAGVASAAYIPNTKQTPIVIDNGVYVEIINKTPADIHVRVTTSGGGTDTFYDVSPDNSETWLRSNWQVAFVLRDDTGATETFIVKPGTSYTIS